MEKDAVLQASRKENKNRDLAELEVVSQAGSTAARVGATVCCLISLLSSLLAKTMLYSPWTIYFSIMATQWLVRFSKLKKKSDLMIGIVFLALAVLAFLGILDRLTEVSA